VASSLGSQVKTGKTSFEPTHSCCRSARVTTLLTLLLLQLSPCHPGCFAQSLPEIPPHKTPASTPSTPHSVYLAARSSWDAAPTNVILAVLCTRAAFDWADTQSSNGERARIAELGMDIARTAIQLDPSSAGAHYYLALNMGQLARTRSLGALKLVSRMESSLLTARSLDETFDHAGPDRTLGLLYQDAPGWPTSIGNRSKARHHLERAVQLAPEYPGNRLAWVEALTTWRERTAALRELARLDSEWPAARIRFDGPRWASDWIEWQSRRDAVATRLGLVNPSPRGSSPE